MNGSVSTKLADADEHYRRGRLSEAEACCRQVLERAPEQPDALHRLAFLARHAGRNDTALALLERAIAANRREAAYYNDAGVVLHALGRIDESIERFRTAVALKPDFAAAQNNVANILREQGRFDEAIGVYRQALALQSDAPELWYNLGNALTDQRAFADAVRAYRNVLSLRADFAPVHARLADALLALGQPHEAVGHYARALAVGETPDAIAGFVAALAAAEFGDDDPVVRSMAARALTQPWSRPADVALACVRLLAADAAIRACVERATTAWPARIGIDALFGAERAAVLSNALLRALLESAPVCDLRVERFLTLSRYALLAAVMSDGADADAQTLPFCCALARQCFIDDYVFSCTDAEVEQARVLRDRLADSLAHGGDVAPMQVAVVAAYFPLQSLPGAQALTERAWPTPVGALVAQQVCEPLDEERMRGKIPRLTPIDDTVSLDVRAQYEEHPYPRWVKLPGQDVTGNAGGRALWRWHDRTAEIDILVAGCGTGQESIEIAQAFPRGRVLAVDLSLASLAYAERKARELCIENVEHAQADLTKLGVLGRRFDLISSVGVLHHLTDPAEGLRTLTAMLVPGGHMLVGLYSERARADVVAARTFIAQRGFHATSHGIRRCRDALIGERDDAFARLARRSDFYVTAECRDLLFHVQEHRFTLPQIAALLDALGVRFEGFVLRPDIARLYATRHPDDAQMEDLESFDAFEAQFPHVFAGMYIFWVQKPC
ncbi:MAG TPA: tetratricopeptide repeat protein [Casimicrobiaceae bacterium]